MENEENPTKFTGGFLTFLFIYFYVIIRSVWDSASSILAWGADYFLVNNPQDTIATLILEGLAVIYGIISIYQAMKRNRGAVASLRWSVVFMLGMAILGLLSVIPDLKVLIGSVFKAFRLIFLIVFFICLCRAKSLRRMFPKEERKRTWLVWIAWIINLIALGWVGYISYKSYQENVLATEFRDAGKIKDNTLILDYATFAIPDGWHVDSIAEIQGLQRASIKSEGKWLVLQSQLGEEKSIREHLINSVMALGRDDEDFISQDETTSVDINGTTGYISRFVMKLNGDTVNCTYATVFDSHTNRNATLSLVSDSLISNMEQKELMERITLTYPQTKE